MVSGTRSSNSVQYYKCADGAAFRIQVLKCFSKAADKAGFRRVEAPYTCVSTPSPLSSGRSHHAVCEHFNAQDDGCTYTTLRMSAVFHGRRNSRRSYRRAMQLRHQEHRRRMVVHRALRTSSTVSTVHCTYLLATSIVLAGSDGCIPCSLSRTIFRKYSSTESPFQTYSVFGRKSRAHQTHEKTVDIHNCQHTTSFMVSRRNKSHPPKTNRYA